MKKLFTNEELETMPMHSLRNAVLAELKRIHEEDPEDDSGTGTKWVATNMGAWWRGDGAKARGRVGRALAELAEKSPDVEWTRSVSNKHRFRYVPFEERKRRAKAATERSRKSSVVDAMVAYFKKEGYEATDGHYRNPGMVMIDADEMKRFLKDKIHPEAII